MSLSKCENDSVDLLSMIPHKYFHLREVFLQIFLNERVSFPSCAKGDLG